MDHDELRKRIDTYIKKNEYVINCIRHNYLCDNWEPKFYFDEEMINEGKEFISKYSSVKVATSKWALIYFAFMKKLIEYNDREYAVKLTLFQAFLNFTFIMKKHFPVKFDQNIFMKAIDVSKGKYLKRSIDFALAKISKDSVDKLFDEYIKSYDILRALIKMYYSKLRHKISQIIKVVAKEYYKIELLSGRSIKQDELSKENVASLEIEKIMRFIRTYGKETLLELYVDNEECKHFIEEFLNLLYEDEQRAEFQIREIIVFKKVDTQYSKCLKRFIENLFQQ